MATKKRSAKKSSKRVAKQEFHSFKVAPNPKPFVRFKMTEQTVYWALISVVVLALGLWVVYLQVKINTIYDQVDSNSYQLDLLPESMDKKHKANY